MRKQLVLHLGRQGVELRIEIRMEDDGPSHQSIMPYEAYDCKGII